MSILEKRFPTILGLLVLIGGLAAGVYLAQTKTGFLGRAGPEVTPSEIKITNISDNSFTVSWVTTANVGGTVSFGEDSSLGSIAADDRDQISGKTGEYSTHHVSLRYLKPEKKYYFKIISGGKTFDNNGQPFLVTTAPTTTTTPPVANPVFGTIQKSDNTPAEGAIVYLTLTNATPLSTLVKPSGNWLITLNNSRNASLSDFVKPQGTEKIEIFVQGASLGSAQARTTITNASPVPQIILGKTYDFSEVAPTPSPTITPTPTASPAATPTAGFTLPQAATPSPSLTSPATEAAIPSDRPIFKGTGVPGKTVTIKIESPAPVTGTAQVDQNGNWTWTPPSGLPPGDHTVTVTTTDTAGNPLKFIRNFTVLASGTQVTEPATPSATAKPSPTPTPTPKPSPTIKPLPTATPSTAPASGNLTPTILILLLGLTFLVLGFGKLFLLDKS